MFHQKNLHHKDKYSCTIGLVSNRAFTLVEIIIVMGMISVIAFVAIYSLNIFYKNTILESATNDLLNNFGIMKHYANSNFIPDPMHLDETWKSPFVYTFGFNGDANGQNYELRVFPYDTLTIDSLPIIDIDGRQYELANPFSGFDLKSIKIEVFSDDIVGYQCIQCITFIGYQSRFIIQGGTADKMCLRLSTREESMSTNSMSKSRLIYINSKQQVIKEITNETLGYSCFDHHLPEDVPGFDT